MNINLKVEVSKDSVMLLCDDEVIKVLPIKNQIEMQLTQPETKPIRKLTKPRKSPCKVDPKMIYTVRAMLQDGKSYPEITNLTNAARATIDRIKTGYYNDKLV